MTSKETWIAMLRRSLEEIRDRCLHSAGPKSVPGEGGERPFRGWLINPFLPEHMGWPPERIVLGERFDLLLKDAEDFPVVYIETKDPGHKISAREREDFEKRVAAYGTLQAAFLTEGRYWERLDIVAPRGTVTIHRRQHIDLDRCSDEEAEAFFLHLKADRYLPGGERTAKARVSKGHPHILEALAADLDEKVDELAGFFEGLFSAYENGDLGPRVRTLTLELFDHWCRKSLIVPLRKAIDLVAKALADGGGPEGIAKVLTDLGFAPDRAAEAADRVAALPKGEKADRDKLSQDLLPLYAGPIGTLAAQTAHVTLARLLVYRIGEDQKVFPVEMSGRALEGLFVRDAAGIGRDRHPALSLLHRVRERLEGFLPSVYRLGEFDWWWVPPDKRALLDPGERAGHDRLESAHEVILKRTLRVLDGYYFGDVDVDVWRNVYQHYLPDEERQKLGGFYTPDELVDLVLDLCGYYPEEPDLARRPFIDLACGSGAFVVGALSRLLRHFEPGQPGSSRLGDGRVAEWTRAEAVLRTVERNLHAVDIHPFAAFLTTINVMFLLLPSYVRARRHNREFSLDLRIFAADSLEKPDAEAVAGDLYEKLNSRIQLSVDAARRYAKMIGERFYYVFGNPPWGGVLKGPLAPVFDEVKKKRFRTEYPAAAVGKYDIYGLFMERGLQILKPGGRLGLVTQDTYLDKEWASSLRKKLTADATVRMVIDLNPFGQLFFRAMNTPAVTILDNAPPPADGRCIALLSRAGGQWKMVPPEKRRGHVVRVVRDVLVEAAEKGRAEADFATARTIPLKDLSTSAGGRWDLAGSPVIAAGGREGLFRVSDLFDPRQGVTPGGCLDVFLMDEAKAREHKLETSLVHKALKSREFDRWRAPYQGRVLFYPYTIRDGGAEPAFSIRSPAGDALDFETPFDDQEKGIRRGRALDRETIGKILDHRIARGIVKYPNAARYLADHYDRLEGRVFEKKRFRDLGRRWYEYHRPRDPALMLGMVPRIVSPTLTKHVKFALDSEGYLSDHACQYLFPRRGARGIEPFIRNLSRILGRDAILEEALLFSLAFLNSSFAQERLLTGRRPTPKGFYQIGEEFLEEIPLILPRSAAEGLSILTSVTRLVTGMPKEEAAKEEARLFERVKMILATG